jgi:hypothetical protein
VSLRVNAAKIKHADNPFIAGKENVVATAVKSFFEKWVLSSESISLLLVRRRSIQYREFSGRARKVDSPGIREKNLVSGVNDAWRP